MIPQTTMPSRLPDASTAEPEIVAPLRIHTPRAISYPDPQPPTSNGIKPFAYLKYRWVMVLFLGGFLASIFAFTAWNLIPSNYTTYSMVRVFSADPVVHSKEDVHGRGDFSTYIKTQAAMIRSNFVLTAALRDPNIAALPMLREQPDPVRYLEEKLLIEFQDGSEIIKISLAGDDPRAISMTVNSIQEAFFREVVEEEIKRKKDRLRQLEDAISKMQEEVKRKHGQIKLANVGMENEVVPGLFASLAVGQLIRLKENLGKIESDLTTWENEKTNIEKKLGNVADEVPPPQSGYVESLDNDPRMQSLARKIDSMITKIEYLIKLSNDPNLSSVIELRQKVADAEGEREKFKSERIAEHQKSQLPLVEKKLKNDLERFKSNIAQLTTQKEKMEEGIEEYQKSIGQNGPTGDAPPQFPQIDLRERTKIITEMLDKANLLRLEVNAPPRVQDFQRAAVPMKKDVKKQMIGTILAGLMGFGLVGLGVVFHESRVRRAMSLADVRNIVLGPVAGVIPARDSKNAAFSANAIGEGVEKTRSHLLQQFSRGGGKTIVVTSALTEEGKGSLAVQLARSFAVNGCRTLLIDFDLRTPILHRLLHVENERGLCEVLTTPLEFGTAIQTLPDGLMFLPAGQWRAEVRQALTPERIEALMDWLRQQCDCVIFNTHPLLSVAETFLLCKNADGVLLSVERHESRLPLVSRAHEKLATVAADAFGIVYQGATTEECLN